MRHVFVTNDDTTQLILVPDNETDFLLLNRLVDLDTVTLQVTREPISVLGISSKTSIIISRKTTKSDPDVTNETQDL